MTSSTNATTPSVTSYKDAIPPEPLPPSHSSTDLYSRNQQQNQIALSSTPSTSTINTTVTAESKPKSISSTTSSIDYPNYSQQTTIPTQANTSPIPPQPIPTNSSSSFEISRQQSMEEAPKLTVDEKPIESIQQQIAAKTEPFGEEHSIERVENLRSNDSNQMLQSQLSTTSKNAEEIDQEEESSTTIDKNTNEQQETEPFENEVDDLQPPAAPRMLSNYEEDEEDYEMEAKLDEEPVIEKLKEEEEQVEKEEEKSVEEEKEDEEMPEIEKEITSNGHQSPVQENIPIVEPVFEKEIESESSKKSSIDEPPPEIEIEPSTSSSTKIEMSEKTNEESNDSKLVEEESNDAMEIAEESPASKTPKTQPRKRPPPKGRNNRSRKSGAAQSRKRKKSESEEEEEEDLDNDFVPEPPSK